MFGALIASGIYVVLVSGIISSGHNLFPSIVTGSYYHDIFNLDPPVAMKYGKNNSRANWAKSLAFSAITADYPLDQHLYQRIYIKYLYLLIALVVGTAIAATMGLVDFSCCGRATLVNVPTPLYFGMPTFEISSIVMMCIRNGVSMIESTGVYLAVWYHKKDHRQNTPSQRLPRRRFVTVHLGGIFNTFPYTGFSQNVGLVKLSGIKKPATILRRASFLSPWTALQVWCPCPKKIPSSVLGGHAVVMFGFVSIQGMQTRPRVVCSNKTQLPYLSCFNRCRCRSHKQ